MFSLLLLRGSAAERGLTRSLLDAAGGMLGGFFATNVGSTHPFGVEGWRFSFHLMAAVAFVTVYLVLRWAVDPRQPVRAVISPLQLSGSTK